MPFWPLWPVWDNNARYISRFKRVSGDLIRLRNQSKLVERSLFAIIDLLQGAKSILWYFIWFVGGWFSYKISIFRKKISFCFITFNFLMLLLLHKTLKGSRNFQGFALIRSVFLFRLLIRNNGIFVLGLGFFFFRQISTF